MRINEKYIPIITISVYVLIGICMGLFTGHVWVTLEEMKTLIQETCGK